MPTYEYRCDVCGATYELFQKMSDPPLETCEACGGSVRKVLYPVAIHFKGSGFYTTDYGRSGARRSGKGAEGDGDKGGEAADKATVAAKGDGGSPASSSRPSSASPPKKEKQPAG